MSQQNVSHNTEPRISTMTGGDMPPADVAEVVGSLLAESSDALAVEELRRYARVCEAIGHLVAGEGNTILARDLAKSLERFEIGALMRAADTEILLFQVEAEAAVSNSTLPSTYMLHAAVSRYTEALEIALRKRNEYFIDLLIEKINDTTTLIHKVEDPRPIDIRDAPDTVPHQTRRRAIDLRDDVQAEDTRPI